MYPNRPFKNVREFKYRAVSCQNIIIRDFFWSLSVWYNIYNSLVGIIFYKDFFIWKEILIDLSTVLINKNEGEKMKRYLKQIKNMQCAINKWIVQFGFKKDKHETDSCKITYMYVHQKVFFLQKIHNKNLLAAYKYI